MAQYIGFAHGLNTLAPAAYLRAERGKLLQRPTAYGQSVLGVLDGWQELVVPPFGLKLGDANELVVSSASAPGSIDCELVERTIVSARRDTHDVPWII